MTVRGAISWGALLLSGLVMSTAASAQTRTRDVQAGPIWNQRHASRRCPQVCGSAGGMWNGNWTTTVQGRMSVCSCDFRGFRPPPPPPPVASTRNVNAGPLWNQGHASQRCPSVCASVRGAWTGQWRTTVPGRMSVCGCVSRY
ncbi:MAG: mannan-binding lectin [Polyangiales bacterium]